MIIAATAKPKIKRFIVCGFDGQDPQLTDKFIEEVEHITQAKEKDVMEE